MKYVLLIAFVLGLALPAFAQPLCGEVAMANAAASAWEGIDLRVDRLRNLVNDVTDASPENKFLVQIAAINGTLAHLESPLLIVPPGFRNFSSPVGSLENAHYVEMPYVTTAIHIDVRAAWLEYYRARKSALDFDKLWEWVLPRLDPARESTAVAGGFHWVFFEADPNATIEPRLAFDFKRKVERDVIEHATFGWKTTKVGYLAIKDFTAATVTKQVAKALDEIREAGARGLVLDLRGNRGGSLSHVKEIGGYLLGKHRILIYQEDIETRQPHGAPERTTADQRIDLPLLILVNDQTASASEVLAGALQHYGIGYLLGEPTYGKGTVLQPVLQEESETGPFVGLPIYLTSTSSIYYFPSMRSPQIYGLPIDFPYAQPGAQTYLREKDMPTAFANVPGPIELKPDARRNYLSTLFPQIEKPDAQEKDPQLFAAVELFHLWLR